MKHLNFLSCPECNNNFKKISKNKIQCKSCLRYFDIKDDIPILLPDNLEDFKIMEAAYHDLEAHHYSEINMTGSYHVNYYIDDYLKIINALKKNSILLEVGGGDGNDSNLIKNSEITIIQSDISIEMVKLAKKSNNHKDKIYVVSDAEKIPCNENTLDAILIVATLHHLPSPLNFFKEAYRVLKPGGILIVGFEPNSWPYFSFYPLIRFIKKIFSTDSFLKSKNSGVSIGDSETEGFSYSDLIFFLEKSNLQLESIKRIWFLLGFFHTILSIINSKLPKNKTLKIPIIIQKILIFIDRLFLLIPILNNLCWHWTLVVKKKS